MVYGTGNRRPWKDRLASSCDKIGPNLIARYEREVGHSLHDPEDFLAWVGLKSTPTALKRVRWPIRQKEAE